MLYADDVDFVSRSSKGLERMMAAIVTARSAVGRTVSEANTEIMCLQTKGGGKVSFTIKAAGQVYKQVIGAVYLDGAISADRELSIEIKRRLQRAWACFQLSKMEVHAIRSPRCALTVYSAVAECRGDRDTNLRLHDVEPEQA